MWPWDDKLQVLKVLSYRDLWRVRMCLRRGEAPGDPRLAAAAVELAEGYGREGRVKAVLLRWQPLFAVAVLGCYWIIAGDGDLGLLALLALAALAAGANLLSDPRGRPEKLARSLEASRRIIPTDSGLGSSLRSADGDGPAVAAGWYADPGSRFVERLWDGESWTTWVRPRSVGEGLNEADPAGWQPHPSKPETEILWSGDGWTDRERASTEVPIASISS